MLHAATTLVTSLYILYTTLAIYVMAYHLYYANCCCERSRRYEAPNPPPPVTVIIPAYREDPALLESAVRSVIENSYGGNVEIVLALDVEDEIPEEYAKLVDKLKKLVRGFDNREIKVFIRRGRKGFKAGAINNVLKSGVKGKYVIILDADAEVERDYISKCISFMEEFKAAVATTKWGSKNLVTPLSRAYAIQQEFAFKSIMLCRYFRNSTVHLVGCGCVLRRDVLEKLGGFPEKLAEDLAITFDILGEGYRVHYIHDAVVFVELPHTLRAFKLQQSRWAYGALDALVYGFPKLVKSRSVCFADKVSLLLFYLLPLSSLSELVLIFALATAIVFAQDFEPFTYFAMKALFAGVTAVYYRRLREVAIESLGFDERLAKKCVGTLAIYTKLVAYAVLASILKFVLQLPHTWHVTPKRVSRSQIADIGLFEVLFTVLYAMFLLLALTHAMPLVAFESFLQLSANLSAMYKVRRYESQLT